MASTRKGFWMPVRLPSSSSIPALPATPSTVPRVEKKSPKKAMKISTMKAGVKRPEKSNWKQRLPTWLKSGSLKSWVGRVVTPKGMPSRVVATMPMRMAPLILKAVRAAMISSPTTARMTEGERKSPSPMPPSNTPMPVFLKPR